MRRALHNSDDSAAHISRSNGGQGWAQQWPVAACLSLLALATVLAIPASASDAPSVRSHIPDSAAVVRPIHVIDRADMERSGMSTIYELLVSRSDYNNFGLYRTTLLGLTATVFMIDGRPIPNPGSNYVLESLPVATVKRIECVNDGAAALYAGGAIGAINIVLRRDFDGATAWAGAERPGQRGSETENAGAMWGGKAGRGHLTVGVDGFRRAEIRSEDRTYSRASWTEGGSFADVAGVSVGGNTLFFRDDT